ncbi:hypothetical protein F4801DRAFT_600057 [Xylaria longipes]|nr:hypothetical protein F4801DRAFT_600057 [Xylaria longipes]
MAPTNQNPNHPLGGNLDGPATAPRPGLVPNFNNPPNLNNLVRAVLVVILVITSIVVLLRVYSRIVLRRVDLPTILVLVAFPLQLAFVFIFFKLVNTYGVFVHMWDLRLRDFPGVNQLFFQGLILYCSIALIIKPAILLDWISIFCPEKTRNFFFWSSCTVLTTHVLLYISYLIIELAACYPFEKNWNLLIPGKCLHTTGLAVGVSATNLAFDVIIFLLPQKVIWGLRMRFWAKIGISIVFSIGLLACIVAAFRLYSSIQYSGFSDITYTCSGIALWSLAEVTSGFIVLCVPCIPKALDRLELNRLGSSFGSWAGAFVQKLVGSGASTTDSPSGPAGKRSKPTMTQCEGAYELKDSSSISPMLTESVTGRSSIHARAGEG